MKLKTLKDLQLKPEASSEAITTIINKDLLFSVNVNELKQEAIKWIKEEITIKVNAWLPAPESELQLIGRAIIHHPDIQRWMNRFNITEEDLKDNVRTK